MTAELRQDLDSHESEVGEPQTGNLKDAGCRPACLQSQTRFPAQVLIRDVWESDIPVFFEHQRVPDVYSLSNAQTDLREDFMRQWSSILRDETKFVKTVVADEHVAGYIICWNQLSRRLIGYWLGREFWCRGIAGKGLSLFLPHVKTRPLYAHVAKENLASIKALLRRGFLIQDEGRFVNMRGEVIDAFILSLTE